MNPIGDQSTLGRVARMMKVTARGRRRRKGWARLARRTAAYLVLAMMVATTVPVDAVAPPGSLAIPDPEDWGVMTELQALQATEASLINEPTVVDASTGMLSDVRGYSLARTPAMGPFDLHSSEKVVEILREIEEKYGHTPCYFLLNRVKPRTILSRETSDYISKTFELPTLKNHLHDYELYKQAPLAGESVLLHAPRHKAAKEMKKLIKELNKIYKSQP